MNPRDNAKLVTIIGIDKCTVSGLLNETYASLLWGRGVQVSLISEKQLQKILGTRTDNRSKSLQKI